MLYAKKLLSYKNIRSLNDLQRMMNVKKSFSVQQFDVNNKNCGDKTKIDNKLINNSDKNASDSINKKLINSEIHVNKSFEHAIEKLNSLLPNYAVIQKSVLNRNEDEYRHIDDTRKLLDSIGISVDDLRKLKVIHVAGTKGKGSTCVLTEQLLKSLGLKTGFYSSPHMFKVTERIRLNGESISDDLFAQYFWKIYQPIMEGHTNENETPEYFKFLTAMAFHIFLEEKVDVAIVEVGIGGKYDPTNLLPHTKTCGITALGIEHTNLLGNTLAEIAWQKSGIIKEKTNIFTIDQPAECMNVIEDIARECKANLQIVPKFHDYKWNKPVKLTVAHNIQKLNASLAIQLAYNWIRNNKHTIPQHILDKVGFLFSTPKDQCPIDVPNEFINPLKTCYWPGRCQILNLDTKKIYFDGAHTYESIKICIEWFQHCTRDSFNPKCLIFNGTGDRDFDKLLKLLFDHLQLDLVYFSPNVAYSQEVLNDSSRYASGGYEGKLAKCYEMRQIWSNLRNKSKVKSNKGNVAVMPSISSIFEQLNDTYKDEKVDILVTGSLHLVGVTLKYLNKDTF